MKESYLHIVAGGTIDSHWDAAKDTAIPNSESVIPNYLKNVARVNFDLDSRAILLKDSRDITPTDQDRIAAEVAETTQKRIIVTSGTYLMPDIARAIVNHPMAVNYRLANRKIVLTGSLVPMMGYTMSDGGFNLGMTAAVLEEDFESPVLLVMNGSCFSPEGVRKNLGDATFSTVGTKDLIPYESFDLVTAGGSMDFVPDGLDKLVPAIESQIPKFLRENVRINKKFSSVRSFSGDSRELKSLDLENLIEIIKNSQSKHILVTMGMYKLKDVQKRLIEALAGQLEGKKVVLTASRLPLNTVADTDATFNLGYALGKIGFLREGIYVSVNGQVVEESQDLLPLVYTSEEISEIKDSKEYSGS